MSERRDEQFLADIQEAVARVLEYTDGIDYNMFYADKKTQDSVIRNLEVIGEAVKNISIELKELYTSVPWSDYAKVRDKLIHHYFGINFDIVWGIIEEELPGLKVEIKKIIDTNR